MVAVVTVEQMRRAEVHTLRTAPIAAIDLMERAGEHCAWWLTRAVRMGTCAPAPDARFVILVGPGNNGGDGLVIARHLHIAGFTVLAVLAFPDDRSTSEQKYQLERARESGVPLEFLKAGELPPVRSGDVCVDALFGIGLDRPIEGWIRALIEYVNDLEGQVVAVDIPSGLSADGSIDGAVLRATWTLTFQWPKPSLVASETAEAVGELVVLPIGIVPAPEDERPVGPWLLEHSDLAGMLRPRPVAGHKGTFGHAVLVAGSRGRIGAAVLATRSCARSGVGTVTTHLPGELAAVVHASVPEAMCSCDADGTTVTELPKELLGSAWGVGPGLGSEPSTCLMLKQLIQEPRGPLVLDADALNILAKEPTWLAFLPAGTVLTPHPKEFDRLVGTPSDGSRERWSKARDLAVRSGCVVVLKGSTTAICTPAGQVLLQRWNNSGLAKGGSGDALTGLITGLLAQGYAPVAASVIGVHLHGSAAQVVALRMGADGMLISDVIEALPEAWRLLRARSKEALHGASALPE
jgi:hydroxyethylthiazole kinase-like uncharacterized protein yjeF